VASVQAQRPPLGPRDGVGLAPLDTGRVVAGGFAPDFTLETKDGGTLTLSQFRGKKEVVLVFYRGHWCPYCTEQLTKLKTLLDQNRKANVELIALAIDTRAQLQLMADKISADGVKPELTFVSDPGHRVIDRYGLLNPNGQGWPHPTTYIIDRQGIVRWKFTEVNYKIRPTNEMILEALSKVEQERK
jgi:peroxiredoxin